MCGVLGWATPRPLDGDLLDRGLDALGHRGPDGRGTWSTVTRGGGQVALGHTRLAILDAAGGAQPLFSHDRRFVISFNGEIYNYLELRERLIALGARFLTRSDTEVVVEAYRAWGQDCLSRFRGMFAFALYDTKAERLVLARDPFGKKPLFLAKVAGGLAFASEIPPLLDLPGVGRRLNRAVLADYLIHRYVPGPATFFDGVRKLAPGYVATCERGDLRERRYFTPPIESATSKTVTPGYAVAAFGNALKTAVRLRLRSDAPYGVYLSGGLDSSTIAALMARETGAVRSYAVGFEDARYSELPHAARVAARIGARHEALTVTAEDFARHWPAAVHYRGAPVSEASDIPLLLLSRAARGSVKMVLTGEGADELLGGYPKHRAERWIGAYHAAVPADLHRRLLHPLARRLPYSARRLKILSRALGEGDPQARAEAWFANLDAERLKAGLDRAKAVRGGDDLSPLRRMMAADCTGWLPDNLLERGDRMTMAAGIESRMPFMDVELATLTASFPDALLFDRRGGKAILRATARGMLDDETINRRKVGFRTPVGDWFRGPLKPTLHDLLCGEGASVRRLLDGAVVDRMLEEHLDGRIDQTDMLWTAANLELFLREHRLDVGD
jgi:asparagine synthase (glutamine-hydrolysing)